MRTLLLICEIISAGDEQQPDYCTCYTHLCVEVSSGSIDSVAGEVDSSCAFPQNSHVPLRVQVGL